MNKPDNSVKRVPERMCVSCRQMKPKNELVRIVLVEDKAVVDATGKLNGRGVYLCKCRQCLERALKNKKFAKAYGFSLADVEQELENIIEREN